MAEPPKLLERVRLAVRTRHYSRRTEEAYAMWIRRYILFHGKKHPSAMSSEEVNAFLSFLAVDRHVSASTQNQALSALLLYREVLQERLPWLNELVRAQRPERLPVVPTVDEVREVIEEMRSTPRLVAMLLYGSGLRLCARADHGARPEVETRSNDDVAARVRRGLEGADVARANGARRGSGAGMGMRVAAGRAGQEVPVRPAGDALAVGISRAFAMAGSGRQRRAAPSTRDDCAAGGDARDARRGNRQARYLPHIPSFVRDASARVRAGHPHSSGIAGTPGRVDDDDLHHVLRHGARGVKSPLDP